MRRVASRSVSTEMSKATGNLSLPQNVRSAGTNAHCTARRNSSIFASSCILGRCELKRVELKKSRRQAAWAGWTSLTVVSWLRSLHAVPGRSGSSSVQCYIPPVSHYLFIGRHQHRNALNHTSWIGACEERNAVCRTASH